MDDLAAFRVLGVNLNRDFNAASPNIVNPRHQANDRADENGLMEVDLVNTRSDAAPPCVSHSRHGRNLINA